MSGLPFCGCEGCSSFSFKRERAVLEWTEAFTQITAASASDEAYAALRTHFCYEEQIKITPWLRIQRIQSPGCRLSREAPGRNGQEGGVMVEMGSCLKPRRASSGEFRSPAFCKAAVVCLAAGTTGLARTRS